VAGFLLVNPRSGSAQRRLEELLEEARRRGVQTHLLRDGDDPLELAAAADATALGMAGGDGSLGAVAQVALERDLPFVCIPCGTRNHFARDAGIDVDDPVAALAAFEGRERRVDLGRVGGRVFLNNVSLGVYARLVHRREHGRRRGEALARMRSLAIALRRPRPVRARLEGHMQEAAVLLVANNSYRVDLFSLGERDRLDEGELHLYAAERVLPWSWDERSGARFRIEVEPSPVPAAIDGEPVELSSPIDARIEPGVLRLLEPGH
jgi:diacylglycerol kinase family enzyme